MAPAIPGSTATWPFAATASSRSAGCRPATGQARDRRQGPDRRARLHRHALALRFLLLEDGNAQSKIRQGVTTEVLGEGSSPGPYQGKLPPQPPRSSAASRPSGPRWAAISTTVERRPASRSTSPPTSAWTTSGKCVMGNSFERPTPAQMDEMKALVDEAMKDGAFGLSSLLAMPPGSLATTDDIVELCKVVAQARRHLLHAHPQRGNRTCSTPSRRPSPSASGPACPWTSSISRSPTRSYWGRMNEIVALIEAARKRGVNVQANVYPYTRGNNNLASIIPPWAHEGGTAKMLARLKDAKQRAADEEGHPRRPARLVQPLHGRRRRLVPHARRRQGHATRA